MKENEIEANVFVYHREWGVGRIIAIEADGQWLLVRFRDQSERRMSRGIALQSLNKLSNDGLEAILWNNPETAHNWVKNGPLRLVAAALADAGGAGKPKDLQARLQQRVLRDIQWGTWWKKIQPALKESSHFQLKGGEYILTTRVSDVPIGPLPTRLKRVTVGGQKSSKTRKPASLKEWIKWLFTGVGLAPPTNTPPQLLLDILEALPTEMMEGVSQQLLSGFRLVLQRKPMPTARALGAWVSAIEELSNRLMESSPPASLPMLSESLVKLDVDLLHRMKNKTLARHFLQILVTNLQRNDLALQGVANGLKVLFQTEPGVAMELLHDFSEQLPDTVRKPLVRRVASGLFREGTPEQHHLLLQAVNERDRYYLLEYLSLLAIDGQIPADRVVETFLGEWPARQKANRLAYLKSLLIVAMLLDAAAEPLHLQAIDEFRSTLREQDQTLDASIVAKLVGAAREEILQTRHELEQRLSQEMEARNTQLLEKQREIDRIHRTVDDLQQEIARRREEAQLEIRRDMLLAIGEVLQILSKKDKKLADLISDVRAGLSLALQAGGAEILGRVGQVVSYDPELHQSDKSFHQGTSVIITAPGVRIGTGRLGGLVLLKACVAERKRWNQ